MLQGVLERARELAQGKDPEDPNGDAIGALLGSDAG